MISKKGKRLNLILCISLLILSIFFLFPIVWMVMNSFKPEAMIAKDLNSIAAFMPPISIITNSSLMRYMSNTLVYAAILIICSIIVNGLAGYALAKIKFPLREIWVFVILLLMIVPMETIITIHFIMIAKAGLLNTVIGYILPMIVSPFNIFLFRQVFSKLPDDLYEAAQLDNCGPIKYFFRVVLPMSKSIVATVGVFTFLGIWNDFLWPSLVFTSNNLLTVQIGLNSITANENITMGQVLATITIVTIPVLIIYSLFSKQLVEGAMSSGSKEG